MLEIMDKLSVIKQFSNNKDINLKVDEDWQLKKYVLMLHIIISSIGITDNRTGEIDHILKNYNLK